MPGRSVRRTEKRSNSTQVEEHRSAIPRSSGFFPLTGLFCGPAGDCEVKARTVVLFWLF